MKTPIDPQKLIGPFSQRELVPRYRLGSVVSIQSDRSITVTIGGTTTQIAGVKYLGNIQPVPNAPIWLVSDGLDVFAFGVQAAAGRTFAPRAYRTTTQSIGDATDTAVSFDTVDSDSWSAWSVANAARLTAPMTGRYMAVGQVEFAANGTGFRAGWIELNGSTTLARTQVISTAAGAPTIFTVTAPAFTLTAGDYIRLIVRQNSTGALNLNTSGTWSPSLSLIYLGS